MSYIKPLLATLVLCTLTTACDHNNLSLSVDESRVQESVAKKFPQDHDLKGIATLTMTNPVIDLKGTDNRIHLDTDLALARPGIPLTMKGHARTSGTIRYEQAKHTFYMTDVRIEKIDIPMRLLSAERKKSLVDLTNAALQGSLKDIPIYTLETSVSQSAADNLLKSVTIKDGKLQINMGK